MWYQLTIGIGGMVLLVLVWVTFNLLAERMRTVQGTGEERCRLDSIKCLGCYVTGKCKSKR